jgi:small nuclear ribonucleoprotein (snRNP)-like protein
VDRSHEHGETPPPPRLVAGPADALSRKLERWAADARVDEAVRTRARERWLRRQAEEEATVRGALVDLCEGATPVTVHTRAGRRYAGTVRAVGADFVALGFGGGQAGVVVSLDALASVRTRPGVRAVLGDRPGGGATRLSDVVAGLAADREQVRLVTVDGESVTGVVRSVGLDILVVRAEADATGVAYVPLAAIGEVVIEG